jgi:hypothetical protein
MKGAAPGIHDRHPPFIAADRAAVDQVTQRTVSAIGRGSK